LVVVVALGGLSVAFWLLVIIFDVAVLIGGSPVAAEEVGYCGADPSWCL
jgi:hypothetical protein